MKKVFKRFSVLLLALCLFATGAMPVFAQTTYTDKSFPFTLNVNQEFGEDFTAEFFKDDQKLYISHDSLLKLDSIEERDYGFRKTDNSMYKVDKSDVYTFDGKKYYPFEYAMEALCFSSYYFTDTDTLSLLWANNIWNIPQEARNIIDDKAYSLYGWQGLDYLDSELNTKDILALMISLNLPTTTKIYQDIKYPKESYDHYKKALWDIMLPEVDSPTNLDIFLGSHEAGKDGLTAAEMVKWDKLKYFEEAFGGLKLASATLDIMSLDDFQDNMEFYMNIANVSSSIYNGIDLIYNSSGERSSSFDKALNDTIKLYNKQESPFDLYMKEVLRSGGNYILDEIQDTAAGILKIADVYKVLGKLTKSEFYKDVNEDLDPLEIASTNVTIMKAAEYEYKIQYAKYLKAATNKDKIKYLQNMRDIMLVYLASSNSAWHQLEGMEEYDEALSMIVSTKADMGRFNGYTYLDFHIYENAAETRQSILGDVNFRSFTVYDLEWNTEEANKAGGINVELDGYDKNGKPFIAEHKFSYYYYLDSGLAAGFVRTGKNDDSGRNVTVYDFDGYCELVIKPKDEKTSLDNLAVAIETVWDFYPAENLKEYLTEENGINIYRIPLPIGAAAGVKPTPTSEPVATPVPDATQLAGNQFIIEGNVSDYLLTFDSSIFDIKKPSYGKGMSVSFVKEIKDELLYNVYTVNLGENKSFDAYYEEWKGIYRLDYEEDDEVQTLSHGQPVKVDIGGGLTAVYFDFECKSSKDPSGTVFINRYCYVDLGTGEYLYSHEFTPMEMIEETGNISYDDYLKKLYTNIEVMPK